MTHMGYRIFGILLIVATALAGSAASNDKSGSKRADDPFFGFSGPETFPIDPFVSELRAADFDGDGSVSYTHLTLPTILRV